MADQTKHGGHHGEAIDFLLLALLFSILQNFCFEQWCLKQSACRNQYPQIHYDHDIDTTYKSSSLLTSTLKSDLLSLWADNEIFSNSVECSRIGIQKTIPYLCLLFFFFLLLLITWEGLITLTINAHNTIDTIYNDNTLLNEQAKNWSHLVQFFKGIFWLNVKLIWGW